VQTGLTRPTASTADPNALEWAAADRPRGPHPDRIAPARRTRVVAGRMAPARRGRVVLLGREKVGRGQMTW